MLVHGEKSKMHFLKKKIVQEFGIPCYDPANGVCVSIPLKDTIPMKISSKLIESQFYNEKEENELQEEKEEFPNKKRCVLRPVFKSSVEGVIVMDENKEVTLFDHSEMNQQIGVDEHKIKFVENRKLDLIFGAKFLDVYGHLKFLNDLKVFFMQWLKGKTLVVKDNQILVNSISFTLIGNDLSIQWYGEDEELASRMLSLLNIFVQRTKK